MRTKILFLITTLMIVFGCNKKQEHKLYKICYTTREGEKCDTTRKYTIMVILSTGERMVSYYNLYNEPRNVGPNYNITPIE